MNDMNESINTAIARILRLDVGGLPIGWVSLEDAASHYCLGEVAWEAGQESIVLRGGWNAGGQRSTIQVSSIIATTGQHRSSRKTLGLTNRALFARDRNICLYCGDHFPDRLLTRDHVIPQCQGGPDVWDNVVAACVNCNGNLKRDRTPEQAGMKLLALPYTPSAVEGLILRNRHILADQMDYLAKMVPDRGKRLS